MLQDLSDCQLKQLPDGLFELTGLQELSLAGNQLQQLPADIAKLSCLHRLVLAGNLLTQLPLELFSLTTLEGLWVHGNLLQELPEQLGQLTKLKQLSLAGEPLARCIVSASILQESESELSIMLSFWRCSNSGLAMLMQGCMMGICAGGSVTGCNCW